MLSILSDIIKTTLLIAIPFTIAYAWFWIWLDKYLYQKEHQKETHYGIDIETYNNEITISDGRTQKTYFIPTYNPSQKMYGPTRPSTNSHNER